MTAAAPAPRQPRNREQATALLERLARLDGDAAAIEAHRQTALANTNATADALARPVQDERAAILAVLEPWWAKAGGELTGGKRKSVELGGCMIGTKAQRGRLAVDAGDEAAITALTPLKSAKPLVRLKASLDRTAILKALDGKHGDALEALGFRVEGKGDAFFAERVAQPGVVGAA